MVSGVFMILKEISHANIQVIRIKDMSQRGGKLSFKMLNKFGVIQLINPRSRIFCFIILPTVKGKVCSNSNVSILTDSLLLIKIKINQNFYTHVLLHTHA